jgi:PHD/YefM family antitoxin component YafN of YafNO toxin-antitoxin module
MSKQLKQVINLSKKTGDRIIVFDNSEPEDSFVLMSLNQYEKLIEAETDKKDLTAKKIIDNIRSEDSTVNNGKGNNWKIPNQIKNESEENQ